jgi:hypothetical protein
MKISVARVALILLTATCITSPGVIRAQSSIASHSIRRAVTIRDSIEATHIGSPLSEYYYSSAATFSPDHEHFVVLTRKGDIESNANDYALLLFRTADSFHSPNPEILASFSSKSNRAGIDNPRWISNTTVAFLGAPGQTNAQIYSYDIRRRKVVQRTYSPTDILAFDATSDFGTLIYLAHPPIRSFFDQNLLDYGFVVSNEWLGDLVAGRTSDEEATYTAGDQIFVQHNRTAAKRVETADKPMPFIGVSLSPDGAYAVVEAEPREVPEAWKEYAEFSMADNPGLRYMLVDTTHTTARPLVSGNHGAGAPNGIDSWVSKIAWLQNSVSVIVSGILLPLDLASPLQRDVRRRTYYTVEVSLQTGAMTTITDGILDLVTADRATDTVFLTKHSSDRSLQRSYIAYRKIRGAWTRVDESPNSMQIDVTEEQDLNSPPRLVAIEKRTKRKATLLELNPQFRDLLFGKVEPIEWIGGDRHQAKGGLYLPPEYVAGTRYPLVIQTHGWNETLFAIDGIPSSAGYAAQALAGKGIIVVQMDENYGDILGTKEEGPMQMNSYEALIHYLDTRGIIDPMRVGLMAWSRSGYGVRYALAFAKYPIATASIVDGLDASYFQYLVELTFDDGKSFSGNLYEVFNGGNPLRDGLPQWEKNAPGFNLAKVHAPVRLTSFGSAGPASILDGNWEWFAGLRHLHKPVELISFPNASHNPVRPSEKLTVQQGNVDWFCFWLLNEEDPDPAKAEQYARWHDLRRQQEEVNASAGLRDSDVRKRE